MADNNEEVVNVDGEEAVATPSKPAEETSPTAEETPSAPAESAGEVEQAGSSELAQELAPKSEKKEEGIDDILEKFRDVARKGSPDEEDDDKDSDLESNRILVGKYDRETIVDNLIKFYQTREAFKRASDDPKSLLNLCLAALDHGWGTTSKGDYSKVLKTKDVYKNLAERSTDERLKVVKDMRPNKITHKNVEVAGREAILALKARLGGIVRINLLSSGFWVAMRAPETGELQEIFATIDFENKEIGRMLGGHFALVPDMYLKRKFAELLIQKRIIIESNFRDIFKPGAFIRNLSFNDYDTLLHGVVTLMARGGLRYQMVCPACGKIETEILDIGACKFTNMNIWTDAVNDWWSTTIDSEGKPITRGEKDLLRYREEILTDHEETLTQIVDNGLGEKVKIDVIMSEPTLARYFDIGERLIKKLREMINGVINGNVEDKSEIVKSSLILHGFQLAAPFVKQVIVYNADGTENIKFSDTEAVMSYLDQTVQNDTSIFVALNSFLAKTRFDYIGTHSIKCPDCGAVPETDLNNFYPLEIQTIFFVLLSRPWRADR